ncbi:hypothetical protein M3J21_09395 [Klebsiella quasipneumoniae]|uniref:hypothetical protein n=1 Tax=Klebsiella quasipneumoniae TaxID=1463165 RepID=UPI0010839138|nr:hypothetical protein [Klebsiella quasipneumoniae]EKW2601878.1 hypothetical protein [Klebsiella quasipneumoniae]MDZ0982355.1 hypothetical protein [Klebsiella quasipneumoniae]VGC55971.1 Uncharacterised protein [Klebsiella quasipneumoniae]HCI6376108.1 hypothetical protein [Klebsiella quasipneumoniae subsp. similipneumoniae]
MAGNYAVIESGIVKNIIIAESGYEYDGAELIEYPESVFCQPGMFFKKDDGLFYDDKEFSKINNII